MRARSAKGAIAIASTVLLTAPAGAACVGDCNADRTVAINEVITGVNIGLGQQTLEVCPVFDANADRTVAINEVITGVNNGLLGCPVEPTATPTFEPTPTGTPSIPDVSGTWRQDNARITSSDCPDEIDEILEEEISDGAFDCTYELDQEGSRVDIRESCAGETFTVVGSVDETGEVTVVDLEMATIDGCVVSLTTTLRVVPIDSPTTATGIYDVRFGPNCGIANCTIAGEARWTRQ